MTDAKFKQLVNSFLDREISQKDHLLLASEIASSPERREEFNRYRKLHAAERQALAKLFAKDCGLGSENAEQSGALDGPDAEARRTKAEQLKARAARAWSEVQLLAVERRKRTMLIAQFAVVAILILGASCFLYYQSVNEIPLSSRYRKESEAINADSARLERLRHRLRSRQGVAIEWVSNERGEPVALVGRDVEGSVFVLTSPELPRLSHSQLAVLMNQLQTEDQPTAVRSRFIVSTQVSANVLPDVDPLMPSSALGAQMAVSRRSGGFELHVAPAAVQHIPLNAEAIPISGDEHEAD